jgi:hypothetical protein
MRVLVTTPLGQLPGILTVICVIGPNPPNSHHLERGSIRGSPLSVPGIINFDHTAGCDNVIIQAGCTPGLTVGLHGRARSGLSCVWERGVRLRAV